MGKIRDLVKKVSITKGTFHAKMGTIKNRNGMDLKKQKIRRGDKNTQKNCTKKIFTTQIITMGKRRGTKEPFDETERGK